MISKKIWDHLLDEIRPENKDELNEELNIAREKGYKIASVDLRS